MLAASAAGLSWSCENEAPRAVRVQTALPTGDGRRLPQWYTSSRVHSYTRLGPGWGGTREFEDAAAAVAALGATVLVRDVKSGDEGAWWIDPPRRIDSGAVATMAEVAHREGVRLIAYYWHAADEAIAAAHPEWVCRDLAGNPAESTHGLHLDLTSGYREVVLERLLQLAGMGFDGFYFDEQHFPYNGCFASAMADAFVADGNRLPGDEREADTEFRDFLDYQSARAAEVFEYWQNAVTDRYPDVVFVVSAFALPSLVNRRVTTRLAAAVHSAKSEYLQAVHGRYNHNLFGQGNGIPEPATPVRLALGWTVLRDAAGRAPNIWSPGLASPDEVAAVTGALLTYGCIFSLQVNEELLLAGSTRAEAELRAAFAEAFRVGAVAGEHLADATPVQWAGVLFSERARDARGANRARVWREVLWPLNAAFDVCQEAGVPIGVLDDDRLERGEIDDLRLIFVPSPADLTASQRAALAEAANAGALVLENDRADWHRAGSGAIASLRAAVAAAASDAPVIVECATPRRRHSVAYRGSGGLSVAISNDFGWVRPRRSPEAVPASRSGRKPAALEDVVIRIRAEPSVRSARDVLTDREYPVDFRDGEWQVRVGRVDTWSLLTFY